MGCCRMQAALIVDVLRSAGYLHENGVGAARMGSVILMGHSMGAGISVATAAMLKNVVGVASEAPAVRLNETSIEDPNKNSDGRVATTFQPRARKRTRILT